jgi:futalosine hydrolase
MSAMKDILIIVPTDREAAFFADRGLDAHVCGVGMAECAASTAFLLADRRPGLAVLAGIAGSYVDELGVGESVVVLSETVADLGRRNSDGTFTPLFQKRYPATFIPEGLPAVHSNTVDAAGLVCASADVAVENMEGAAFMAVCERFGVPAMELRTISNRVGEPVTSNALTLASRRLAEDLDALIRRL